VLLDLLITPCARFVYDVHRPSKQLSLGSRRQLGIITPAISFVTCHPQPRHHYLPYPTLPRKFTAPTLWVATSMLRAPLPCRVGHAPRAIHTLSLFPLVEAADLRVPRASTRVITSDELLANISHTVPSTLSPDAWPDHFPHIAHARPYETRHCRRILSLIPRCRV
jgi:hypothetical protein